MELYNEQEKARRNAAYLEKLDRGLAQIHAGKGVTKTLEELRKYEAPEEGENEGV